MHNSLCVQVLLYWEHYCTAFEQWVSVKLCCMVSWRDRAAILLNIGRSNCLVGILLCYCVSVYVCFSCVRYHFFSTMPRDGLRRTSPKSPVLCRVGHETLTQSIKLTVVTLLLFTVGAHCRYDGVVKSAALSKSSLKSAALKSTPSVAVDDVYASDVLSNSSLRRKLFFHGDEGTPISPVRSVDKLHHGSHSQWTLCQLASVISVHCGLFTPDDGWVCVVCERETRNRWYNYSDTAK